MLTSVAPTVAFRTPHAIGLPNWSSTRLSRPPGALPLLSPTEIASLRAAVKEEIDAAPRPLNGDWMHIDGIEQLSNAGGKFSYRLVLSKTLACGADQKMTFQMCNSSDIISAVVISCNDEGLVVECDKPLATDARLLGISFDPTFILKALESFVLDQNANRGVIARQVFLKQFSDRRTVTCKLHSHLNDDQSCAVEEMASTPLYFLWGPPGTGKTTTIGAAVVNWLRQGKRVLIASTSNAAVDVAMRAVLKRIRPDEQKLLIRLGTSLDDEVQKITLSGRYVAEHPALAQTAANSRNKLCEVRHQLQCTGHSNERLQLLFAEARKHEQVVEDFNTQVDAATAHLIHEAQVMACTLARIVLDEELRRQRFDVVVVDEASMAPFAFVLCASFLASSHLVLAGDPMQLPPIAHSDRIDAVKWFKQNVYDWYGLGVDEEMTKRNLCLLRTQYRMTASIGDVVSRLTYGGRLQHGRGSTGSQIEFIDMDREWQTCHYSVTEESYFHLAAIPIMHALAKLIGHDDVLLLSPFRAQRSLLAALAFDLRNLKPSRRITASTIHRAQGSEARAVIVDLTTHSPTQLVKFFQSEDSAKLFNVAISRAKDQLIILGSRSMLSRLAGKMPFWDQVVSEFGSGIDELTCEEVIEDLDRCTQLSSLVIGDKTQYNAIYSHDPSVGAREHGSGLLRRTKAGRKLLVAPHLTELDYQESFIVRESRANLPTVFVGGGFVCVPFRGQWVVIESPNVSRVIWRIGFSHLADDEVDPADSRRFCCPRCQIGQLVLQKYPKEGWFLSCIGNPQSECRYRRRPTIKEAKLKIRLSDIQCPHGHPMTARSGRGSSIFVGCENYPHCTETSSLAILEGM